MAFVVALVAGASQTPDWLLASAEGPRSVSFSTVGRQDSIDAPVDGRIIECYVIDGARVKAGAPLVDIANEHVEEVARLARERVAARERAAAADMARHAFDNVLDSLRAARTAAAREEKAKRLAAEGSVQQAEGAEARAALAARSAARSNADHAALAADLHRARSMLRAARSELSKLASDQRQAEEESDDALEDAMDAKATAESEIASALAELTRIEVRLAEHPVQHIRAPAAGRILRVLGHGQVKAGVSLFHFVADTDDDAIDLRIDGRELRRLHRGEQVLVQLENWPTMPFSGTLTSLESNGDGAGALRVRIHFQDVAHLWPPRSYVEPGTRVRGRLLVRTPLSPAP